MQRFLTWTAALTVVFAVGVAAQANLTLEDHAKIMKANAQAAMKMFQGSCGGCHKQYRDGDPQAGYKFKPDF